MEVNLLYGRNGKQVNLPDDRTEVILPKEIAAIEDEAAALRQALRNPIGSPALRDLVGPSDQVAIVFSDITRPMPYDRILPVLLEELSQVPDDRIVFVNATGTHRPNTPEELVEILGEGVVRRFRIVQHDCRDQDRLVRVGRTSRGNELWVNRTYMESSVRILTGFIEPHLFAGFSGGPKAVLPGIAAATTIYSNHGVDMIGHAGSGFARTHGNPIWEEMMEAALLTEPTFILNITQTPARRITGVFAGDLERAHAAGVEFVKEYSLAQVDEPFEIVLTTAGGYPLDINMYQSVKGIAVTENIIKPGGSIILASACQEGLPAYGEYRDIVKMADSPDELLEILRRPGFHMQDQWDVQIQAQLCKAAHLYIYSEGLTDAEIRQAMGYPCRDIESKIDELLKTYGPEARIAVLPAGPLCVPSVA